MSSFTMLSGRGTRHRYRQGHGGGGRTRRYRQGHGRKMQMFNEIIKKGLAMGQKHVLPHIKQIGKNVLLDALEGHNVGHSLKNHTKQAALSSLRGQRKRRV